MNLALSLSRIWRRWYILVPGLILAIAIAIASWQLIPSKFERTATQLLLPGTRSLPEHANPYYYLGGLSQAADVLVTAVGSENVLNSIEKNYPGTAVEVSRDVTTSGPVITIVVTARTDREAGEVLDLMVQRTATELETLQSGNRAARADRITVVPVTVDQQSTERQRDKLVATGAMGGGVLVLAIAAAALVEGLTSRPSRRGSPISRSALAIGTYAPRRPPVRPRSASPLSRRPNARRRRRSARSVASPRRANTEILDTPASVSDVPPKSIEIEHNE